MSCALDEPRSVFPVRIINVGSPSEVTGHRNAPVSMCEAHEPLNA
jgi:hypothetical protein